MAGTGLQLKQILDRTSAAHFPPPRAALPLGSPVAPSCPPPVLSAAFPFRFGAWAPLSPHHTVGAAVWALRCGRCGA